MAVFNGGPELIEAIASIRDQTHRDWEMIIVNDGSTDDSGSVVDELAARDRRIVPIHLEANIGQPAALNIGWRAARTDLIARMDSDDVSEPSRLERQLEYMRGHPDVAVLGTAAVLMDGDGTDIRKAIRPEDHESLAASIYRQVPFFHPSVMIRREFLEHLGGYDPRLLRAQDLDLWLRGYRRFRYANLREPLIRYRIRHRQSLQTILEGTLVLARAARRERAVLSCGWYAPRYFLATLLAKLRLRDLSFD
jgi:glycosyltransferase involved in cell wall biosynthesis